MEVDELLARLKVGLLWTLFGFSLFYMMRLAYRESLKYSDPPEYMSGLLVFEDQLKCGLVRTQNMDRLACQLSGAICSELKDYNQRKIRILARKAECTRGNEVLCSREGEFNEPGFNPKLCYDDYLLVKVFPKTE